ncbi:MAG: hypothetical protein OEV00_07200 [Acidobacteriota bacterium]|nr:hypothetical protein [Acidobacteriota bacterium]MDH3785099.1 hypothetical protein [Acidobacteriota bacterium]
MKIDRQEYDRIADLINSDDSPVGIDAKKTHVYIIHLLQSIERRLDALEATSKRD